WTKMVGLWWGLERSTGFASSPKGFATKGRPKEVAYWVKCARKGSPNIENVGAFVADWKGWWKGINPEWRIARDGTLRRTEEGPWDTMKVPGANGFLSVLVCLKWWKDAGGEGDWADSVADVTWVLERLCR
ncbi:hypothetical protein B0H13DRAFT_1669770, partial [Mycena leptocephala]